LTSQTALVFEQLGPEARRLARLAALTFLETANARRQVAVFTLDRGVHQIAPYTADQARLRDAVDRAAGQAGRPMERGGSVPGAEYGSGTAQPTTSTRTDNPFIRAHATLDGLSGVIETLRPHTGRKTIVLFSEGLAFGADQDAGQLIVRSPHQDDTWLSDNRREHFTRVIEAANGARVSFYTFDAAGLRVHGPPIGFGEAPYVGLSALAAETGGSFIESTNDLAPGLLRMSSDLDHNYLLGYEPTTRQDGSYRRIDVRVRKSGMSVLARRGYKTASSPR
jgi:VWFA-related protein